MTELTQDLVRELFDYRNGNLYWKKSGSGRNFGDIAGNVQKDGYVRITINSRKYLSHRLIFLYHHGYLPEFLDHIDGDKGNNNITNLREATNQQNHWNQKKNKSHNGEPTSSRFKGVSWDKHAKKWRALITINGKLKHLGLFTSEIEATKAYDRTAVEAFGEFAKPNGI